MYRIEPGRRKYSFCGLRSNHKLVGRRREIVLRVRLAIAQIAISVSRLRYQVT
jgi:hypothetical protein